MPDWKPDIFRHLAGAGIDPARESEIVDELAQHLEDCYESCLADGASESEARRVALAELNDSDLMTTELRKTERRPLPELPPAGANSTANVFAGFWPDLRYAARTLRKSPGFTVFVALTLALGVGANTAVFTLINTILLNPLPVRDSSSLVAVETRDKKSKAGGQLLPLSWLNLKEYDERNQVFSQLAGYSAPRPLTLSQGHQTERIFTELVTANYFETLGLRPVLGRFFRPEEDRTPGESPVGVIGFSAWQQRFGGTPDILGRTLRLNNNSEVTIVGVAPEGFKGVTVLFGPDLWIPVSMTEQLFPGQRNAMRDRSELAWRVASRLKPGISSTQAEANVQTIAAALKREFPELNQDQTVTVRSLTRAAQGDSRQSMLFGSVVLMLVVGLVLLIACSNAASLFLARAAGRRQEIAVRLALGASRKRLIRQLLTESMLLGLISGIAGLAIACEGCQLIWSFRPAQVAANFVDPKMDATVVMFALFVSLLTGILFGLAPAIQSSRSEVIEAIKEEARTAARSRGRVTFRNVLLSGQVALSLVALDTAALFLRSMQRAHTIDPGFQIERLAVFMTNQDQAGYDRARAEQFYRDARAQVSSMPAVASVSWASNFPLWNRMSRAIAIEGEGQLRKQDALPVIANTVDLDYFATMSIPVLQGRDFTAADRDGSTPVAIVNQALAAKYWPKQSPLGKRFQFFGEPVYRQIVGVAKTANYTSLNEEPQPAVFLPYRQNFAQGMILFVRTQGDPSPILTAVQRELRSIDPQLDVNDARTGATVVDQALFMAKMGVGLLSVFGLLGLTLASVGLYGIIAYSVGQRRREIGVRVALGAAQGSVLRMIIRQGMTLVASGVVVGLGACLLLAPALTKLLYGVSPADPISLLTASSVLFAVALVACYLPARRASRMDPLAALRET